MQEEQDYQELCDKIREAIKKETAGIEMAITYYKLVNDKGELFSQTSGWVKKLETFSGYYYAKEEAEIARRVILEETGVQAKIKFSLVATIGEVLDNFFS